MIEFPQAHFDAVGRDPIPWEDSEDGDPDDEEIDTPPDVAGMLGFDPAIEPRERTP